MPTPLPYAAAHDDIQVAGLSSFRQTRHDYKLAGSRGGQVDFSLLQPGRGRPDANMRLDPAAFDLPAGGLVKPNHVECGIAKIANVNSDRTDPITHFKSEGLDREGFKPKKKRGYNHAAAGQSWTWAQDPKVIASLGLDNRPPNMKQKFSVGADGQRHYNMCGIEDLIPAASKDYIKCDRPARDQYIERNDKENLAYCFREGLQTDHTKKRPVHEYWQSDGIWSVMRDEGYMKVQSGEWPRRRSSQPKVRAPSLSSDDGSEEWRNEPISRGNCQRELQPGRIPDHRAVVEEDGGEYIPEKMGPWMPLDAMSGIGSTPRTTAPSESRTPALSMTPRSLCRREITPRGATPRRDTTPRGSTPRSATPRSAAARTPQSMSSRGFSVPDLRSKPTASVDLGTPRMVPSRREVACQVSPDVVMPLGVATPLREVLPQSSTPRDATPRASLSMTPVMLTRDTRRAPTPRNSTPRGSACGSTRGMRKCASEAAFSCNS